MNTTLTLSGIDAAFVKDWANWDGDHSYLHFFDCTLNDDLEKKCNLGSGTMVTLFINIEDFFSEGSITISRFNKEDIEIIIAKITPVLNASGIFFKTLLA